jgi:Flp pilus assembly protein TadG
MSGDGQGRMRRRLRPLGRDDRGEVGVLVGLLLGTVLLGLGALVIEVGQLYQERAQLQSGADAAANAVAKSRVLGTCTSSSAMSTALTYADDGTAGVLPLVCGSGALGTCSTSTGASASNACKAALAADWLNPANQCKGSSKCINGYFAQNIVPYTGSMSSTYLGAAVIRITG